MAQINQQQTLISLLLLSIAISQSLALNLGLVQTGESALSAAGRHVSVWVPGIYSLNLDTRGNHSGSKMDQSVLGGFVRVNSNRKRGADDRLHGPLSVSVAGITMYENNEPAPTK